MAVFSIASYDEYPPHGYIGWWQVSPPPITLRGGAFFDERVHLHAASGDNGRVKLNVGAAWPRPTPIQKDGYMRLRLPALPQPAAIGPGLPKAACVLSALHQVFRAAVPHPSKSSRRFRRGHLFCSIDAVVPPGAHCGTILIVHGQNNLRPRCDARVIEGQLQLVRQRDGLELVGQAHFEIEHCKFIFLLVTLTGQRGYASVSRRKIGSLLLDRDHRQALGNRLFVERS